MGINIAPNRLSSLKSQFKLKWSDCTLKCLGTLIPSDLTRTFELNFSPLLTKICLLLEEWNRGLHSWFGSCNLLKMCILPKFFYLFQALPVKITPQYFRQAHSFFIKFIRAHSKPRLRTRYLTLPKHYGGLALPDLRNYYLAVHLGRIIDWNRHGKTKLWTQLERAQTVVLLKGDAWFYDQLPSTLTFHPVIGTSLRIGSKTIQLPSPLETLLFSQYWVTLHSPLDLNNQSMRHFYQQVGIVPRTS